MASFNDLPLELLIKITEYDTLIEMVRVFRDVWLFYREKKWIFRRAKKRYLKFVEYCDEHTQEYYSVLPNGRLHGRIRVIVVNCHIMSGYYVNGKLRDGRIRLGDLSIACVKKYKLQRIIFTVGYLCVEATYTESGKVMFDIKCNDRQAISLHNEHQKHFRVWKENYEMLMDWSISNYNFTY